jgi:predicted RNase H-like HicB family nuclease
MRQVILYKEDGYWVVECPSLKGCISRGKTKEEALANIKEAIAGYIAALEEDGDSYVVGHSAAPTDTTSASSFRMRLQDNPNFLFTNLPTIVNCVKGMVKVGACVWATLALAT